MVFEERFDTLVVVDRVVGGRGGRWKSATYGSMECLPHPSPDPRTKSIMSCRLDHLALLEDRTRVHEVPGTS